MSESENEEPKIIVDGDWKEQVAKEKEQADQAPESESQSGSDDFVPKQSDADIGTTYSDPPPASFEILISMLFTQAMAMLGQIPDPTSGETNINKPFAKHTIDTLEMLGEKTKGNLTNEEGKILSEALHALRMAYVSTKA